jgi:hypothetical protein
MRMEVPASPKLESILRILIVLSIGDSYAPVPPPIEKDDPSK